MYDFNDKEVRSISHTYEIQHQKLDFYSKVFNPLRLHLKTWQSSEFEWVHSNTLTATRQMAGKQLKYSNYHYLCQDLNDFPTEYSYTHFSAAHLHML